MAFEIIRVNRIRDAAELQAVAQRVGAAPSPHGETAARADRDDHGTGFGPPLELFFDLVFVFALTRVTDWMADEPTVTNVVRGILILTVMW